MADIDKLVKVGQLDTIVDEIVGKFSESNDRTRWYSLTANVTDGSYVVGSTGGIGTNANLSYTEVSMLPFRGKGITIQSYLWQGAGYAFLDENGAYITGESANTKGITPAAGVVTKIETSVPYNAYVLRVSLHRNTYSAKAKKYFFTIGESKATKVVFIGDSYGTGYNTGGSTTGWVPGAASALGLKSSDFEKQAKGGAGFRHPANTSPNETFTDLLNTATLAKENVGRIIVCGGYNDHIYTVSQLLESFGTFTTKAREKYPFAEICVGMIGHTGDASVQETIMNTTRQAYMQMANVPGVRYLSNVECTLTDENVASDQVHPNQAGATALGTAVGNAVKTGSTSGKVYDSEIADINGRLDQIDDVLETGSQTVTVPVEAYGINASTGKNTSSSYWQYYRTAGFYNGTHVKATSTKGTLRSRIYFYASEDVDTFVFTASDYSLTDLDEDVVYPEGATCFRVSGFVSGNPDNPLDLSAVTLEIEIPGATNVIDTIESEISDIQSALSETAETAQKAVLSAVDTDIPYNLIPSDMEWTDSAQVDTANGGIISHTTRCASDYIEIDSSEQYLQIHIAVINKEYNEGTGDYIKTTVAPFVDYQYAFYDENKAFVASTSVSTDWVKVIPATAKYVRVTLVDAARKPFARLIYADSVNQNVVTVGMMEYKKIPTEKYQMPLTGYENFKMICFGDSITHGDTTGNNDGLSYVNYAAQYLNADIESVGFGSTTAGKVSNTGTGLFCFPNLCDCIVSDDSTAWDSLDAWAASENTSYAEHLTRLKAVDWSQVKAVSILYGANDWAQNIPVGSDYNVTPGNYDGGIAYGITQLLTKYPHLQVMVLSPFYRSRTTGGETVISDDANGAGLTMMDYAASLKNVQKKLHVPVVDSGNWGINYLTMKVMSVDGTHPITNLGKQRIGHWFASAVKAYLSPI